MIPESLPLPSRLYFINYKHSGYLWRAYLGRSILEKTGIAGSTVDGGSMYPGKHCVSCCFLAKIKKK